MVTLETVVFALVGGLAVAVGGLAVAVTGLAAGREVGAVAALKEKKKIKNLKDSKKRLTMSNYKGIFFHSKKDIYHCN